MLPAKHPKGKRDARNVVVYFREMQVRSSLKSNSFLSHHIAVQKYLHVPNNPIYSFPSPESTTAFAIAVTVPMKMATIRWLVPIFVKKS